MTMMTMIALVCKILIMMMMMTMVGKMITIKMIRITQVNDRNIMMMIENGRFSRTLVLEKLCESLFGP